jgi:transposase
MRTKSERERLLAIERYRKGERISSIARSLGHSRQWVYKWIERHEAGVNDHHWQESRSTRPSGSPHRISGEMIAIVKMVRLHLYNHGLFCGAQAIEWELRERGTSHHRFGRLIVYFNARI